MNKKIANEQCQLIVVRAALHNGLERHAAPALALIVGLNLPFRGRRKPPT